MNQWMLWRTRVWRMSWQAIGCVVLLLGWTGSAVAYAGSSSPSPYVNVAPEGVYTVSPTGLPDPQFSMLETSRYPGPTGGLVADSSVWKGFLRQMGRTITVTLPAGTPIARIAIQFLQNPSRGILFPSAVQFELSDNGWTWYEAGNVPSAIPLSDAGARIQSFAVSVNRVLARYVRIQFPVDVWVLARQLVILCAPGQPPSSTQLPLVGPPPVMEDPLRAGSPQAGGIHNMLLVYSGGHGAEGTWTTRTFLPMIRYMPTPGHGTQTMFDGFLFLPYGSSLSSLSAWWTYLNTLFTTGQQLAALNQAVEQGGASRFATVKVIVALPYLSKPAELLQNRRMARYVRALLAKWKAAHFSHLQLVGLYWDHEAVSYAVPDELAAIQTAATVAHQADLHLFWIPSFDAPGVVNWRALGFDAVILQPHYYPSVTLPVSRVTDAANEADQLGLGVEVELGFGVLTSASDRVRYAQELQTAVLSGAGSTVLHAWYDASQVLTDAAYSLSPQVRAVYQETYAFLSGTLPPVAQTAPGVMLPATTASHGPQ